MPDAAPKVILRLVENPDDPERPFAFLASVEDHPEGPAGSGGSGGSGGGRLRRRRLLVAAREAADAGDAAGLAALLAPLDAAARRLPWLRGLVDSRRVFHPLAFTAADALGFLRGVGEMNAAGLEARVPDWWKKRARPRVDVAIGKTASRVGADALLDFSAALSLGDATLSPEEAEGLLGDDASGEALVLLKGRWAAVDAEQLREAVRRLRALEAQNLDGVSLIAAMRMLGGAAAGGDEPEEEDPAPWVHATAGDALRKTLERLRDPARLDPAEVPGLRATLRPYQREGVAWLRLLGGLGLGACLADDMGLGKTLQVLATLRAEKEEADAPPALLVVPASLLHNWEEEARRFTPDLAVELLHPAAVRGDRMQRAEAAARGRTPAKAFRGRDLVVTTYAMATRLDWLARCPWSRVILDEAQAIKNPQTKQSRAVKAIPAPSRVAMTGTPVENRLSDLWSLFDFLNPGLLGSRAQFKKLVGGTKQKDAGGGDAGGSEQPDLADVRRLVSPYLLRRSKTDKRVIADLPEKTVTRTWCTLTPRQAKLYEATVARLAEQLGEAEGVRRKALVVQTLTRLKQACNHPDQLTGEGDWEPRHSGKMRRLVELAERLAEAGERVLVFTQFRETIGPLLNLLEAAYGRGGDAIHGGVPVGRRKQVVSAFQAGGGPPFLVLSLKAAGTGLNLTAAAQVVHFDRWWNPAVESQATDRAFRIGQKRNVFVHTMITRGTVEEKIDAMIEDKRALAAAVLPGDGGEPRLTELGDDALLDLVRLDAGALA